MFNVQIVHERRVHIHVYGIAYVRVHSIAHACLHVRVRVHVHVCVRVQVHTNSCKFHCTLMYIVHERKYAL